MNNPKIELVINGITYQDCWSEIEINKSMTNLAGTMHLKATNFDIARKGFSKNLTKVFDKKFKERIQKNKIKYDVHLSDEYIILVDGKILSTGFLDEIEIERGSDGSMIDFVGREATCDLVDCNVQNTINNITTDLVGYIELIVQQFGKDVYGVDVDPLVRTEAYQEIKNITIDVGANVIELIMKECLKKGIIPITKNNGDLKLTRGTTIDYSVDWITDTNIISRRMMQSNMERFSRYFVYGQNTADDTKINIKDYTDIDGFYEDNAMLQSGGGRIRPFVILAEDKIDKAGCEKRAIFEANIRAGNSRYVEYTLQGWQQVTALTPTLWDINKLVYVQDNYLKIDEWMLISDVRFSLDVNEGYTTKIKCVHKDTFSLKDSAELMKYGFDVGLQ